MSKTNGDGLEIFAIRNDLDHFLIINDNLICFSSNERSHDLATFVNRSAAMKAKNLLERLFLMVGTRSVFRVEKFMPHRIRELDRFDT